MTKSKLDWQKYLLFAAMAAVAFMLLQEYSDFKDRQIVEQDVTTVAAPVNNRTLSTNIDPVAISDDSIPVAPEDEAEIKNAVVAPTEKMIRVLTDSLDVLIDSRGGDIIKVALPQHYAKIDTPDQPFVMLNRTENTTYIAQSGLIGTNGTDKPNKRPIFASTKSEYVLADGQDELQVVLTTMQGDVKIEKVFTFKRSDYLIDLQYKIDNQSDQNWKAVFYAQILRDSYAPVTDAGIGMQPFLGAALTTKEENYKKFDFGDIQEATFKETINGGWVAMVQHYFVSAWIPDQNLENRFTLQKFKGKELYSLGFTTPNLMVDAGQQGATGASFYAGPKDVYRLEEIAPYLDLTVDYSWLWWVAKPLFYFLHWIYSLIGNWGLSIIALTIAVKAIFFKLSATSYRSMANMRKIQPQMVRMKELYGSDRARMSQEMMKLYKKEKVNPMGGCLPVLVQMPVFLALYWVLMESVELRHTAFLWVGDLSVKDPYFILPLLMGLTMFIQMKLNPTPPDPTQAKIMQIMPVAFTFLFMWFPAGLVLYWVTNNTLSIAQQYVITKNIEDAHKEKEEKNA